MINHVGPQDQAGHISEVGGSMIDHVGPQDQAGHISEVERSITDYVGHQDKASNHQVLNQKGLMEIYTPQVNVVYI